MSIKKAATFIFGISTFICLSTLVSLLVGCLIYYVYPIINDQLIYTLKPLVVGISFAFTAYILGRNKNLSYPQWVCFLGALPLAILEILYSKGNGWLYEQIHYRVSIYLLLCVVPFFVADISKTICVTKRR
jgi:biotin transporter BioY